MFRVTAVRRFAAAQPRLQPPSASVSQAMHSANAQSNTVSSSNRRVAMMPGTQNQSTASAATFAAPTNVADASAAEHTSSVMNSMDDILSVGTVSKQSDAQKVSMASHTEH